MNISTIIYGGSTQNREDEIKKLFPNFKWDSNPDLKIIERIKTKKSIGIEEVKTLSNFLKVKPLGAQKIIIIKEANTLTQEAQNSLLKILEEPPEYASVFLESNTIENLLPTILSRCQKIKLASEVGETFEFSRESDFLKMSPSERFDYCETLSKMEKEEIISYLTEVLKAIKKVPNTISLEDINLLISTLENLSKFNINSRLALENLALNFNNRQKNV